MFKSLGIVGCVVYLILASQMGGFAPGFSIVFLSFLTMFAGTLALAGLSAPSDITRGSFRLIREPLPLTLDKLVTELEEISVITRRDGLLALESRRKELKEPLLKLLLKRIVEGFDKTQTLHLLRNQALRRAELIRTTEIYIERITALLPTVGLIPALLILIDYLSHPDKVPAPGSLPTLFFPFVLALIAQLIVSALAGRFFDEIKENVKLYYVLMEEGVSGIQDGTNAEMLRDRLRARWADSPQWDD